LADRTDPPYLRIAAELRQRVLDGRLAPGDRVPSTRQIAREWNVALATATKALALLRQEGTVEARPRIGTVVAPRPVPVRPAGTGATGRTGAGTRGTTPAMPGGAIVGRAVGVRSGGAAGSEVEGGSGLSLERIVRTAIEIADTEGLAAVSMRGVAARLGVATMSPYRYVTAKDDLIMLMADAAFGELGYPEDPPDGWRARLELGARTLWALYRRHPWLAQISTVTRPLTLPNLAVHAEWALNAVDGHGLDPVTMLHLNALIYSYVHGIAVNLEREANAEAATGMSADEWMTSQQPMLETIAASGRHPTFAKVIGSLPDDYDLDLNELFEFGLTPLLDGFAALIEGRPPARRPAPRTGDGRGSGAGTRSGRGGAPGTRPRSS
jgi:AcrR family transcriptional regulator